MGTIRKNFILIRADANIWIGTGHIVRCLTLADALRQRGAHISFICREDPGNLILFLETKGYKVYSLPSGIDIESDRELTQKTLEHQQAFFDWLIIDNYDLDIIYESSLRKFVKHIMVIDDLANRHHDCDLLLDQNYSLDQDKYQELVPASCIRLIGPKYAMLRPQFWMIRRGMKTRCYDEVKRIFVFMGGTDPSNETCKVLRSLQQLERSDIAIDVVIGTSNPRRHVVEALTSQIPHATCHIHVENMAELMVMADIGIGAAGTTTWERCCLGLSSVVVVLTENQRSIAETLDQIGAVVNLGWHELVMEDHIKRAVEKLIQRSDLRKKLSVTGKEIVDGKGTNRVINKMMLNKKDLLEGSRFRGTPSL